MATKKKEDNSAVEKTKIAHEVWNRNEPVPGSTDQLECFGDVWALSEAMGRAYLKFDPVLKTEKGQVGGKKTAARIFDYAGLQTLYHATKPALIEEGVFIYFFTVTTNPDIGCIEMRVVGHGGMMVARKYYHSPTDIKLEGAAQTYLIRYMYRNLLGIPGEDADSLPEDIPTRSSKTKRIQDNFAPPDVRPRKEPKPKTGKFRPDEPLGVSEVITDGQMDDLRGIVNWLIDKEYMTMSEIDTVFQNVTTKDIKAIKRKELLYPDAIKLIVHMRGIQRQFEAGDIEGKDDE